MNTVHVACAANAAYVLPLTTLLVSVVDQADQQRDLHLHIVSNDASEQDRTRLRDSIELVRPGLAGVSIHWYPIDAAVLARLPGQPGSYVTKETYARILLPAILPESCEQVLWLDCDMIVLHNVAELYDLALGTDTAVHAVHDLAIPWVSHPRGIFDYAERGLAPDAHYFSAGTLVMNLRKWRELNIAGQLLDYLERYSEQIRLADQGALNAILARDWTPVDLRWNQAPQILFEPLTLAAGYSRQEWRTIRDHPYVVHYSGREKPWDLGRHSPRFSYYYQALRKTVYRQTLHPRPHPEDFLGFPLYYQLWWWTRKLVPGAFQPDPEPPLLPSATALKALFL